MWKWNNAGAVHRSKRQGGRKRQKSIRRLRRTKKAGSRKAGSRKGAKVRGKTEVGEGIEVRSQRSEVREKAEGGSDPYTEMDKPEPQDAYAVSKWEAEQGLMAIAEETGMEIVIIRPPLVYGPGVKANFRLLMKWVKRDVPLPLGAVHNKRSFVALDNLVSFIIHCMDHPRAANEVFLISDGEDVSTTELLQKMARAFGKRSFLLPVPVGLMAFVVGLIHRLRKFTQIKRRTKNGLTQRRPSTIFRIYGVNKVAKVGDVADRLFGSLQVDSSKARDLLGWKPVVSMDEGLVASRKA